jgi:hypothetical protein
LQRLERFRMVELRPMTLTVLVQPRWPTLDHRHRRVPQWLQTEHAEYLAEEHA